MQEISLSRLRQTPPDHHQLGPNDILGVYIENVLGKTGEPPPVNFPEDGERDPSIGFPIPVREDGSIALPLIPPMKVEGLTIEQVTNLVRKAYTQDQKLLPSGKDRIIVTLIKRRTYQVLVVREESGAKDGVTKRGDGAMIDLPVYENDLLHALNATGGLPGTDAKNEVLIIRDDGKRGARYDQFVSQVKMSKMPCQAPPIIPDAPNVIRIPLRFHPDQPPTFTEQDIILNKGDIVMIQSRESEKFYTGGVLGGGEHLIPRDYDLDVLGAIAMAGGPVGSAGNVFSSSQRRGMGGGGGGSGARTGPVPPSQAIVIRKLPDGSQIPIKIDLNRALTDSSERILIQPDDIVMVRYTCAEEVINTALSLLQINILTGFR
ncbi:MAG: sugar ABC transporter substrate-binding protein [Planctomycetota bacterium]|jgi:protein involved in polysaccharide export with SLBB domain|nr:MAG: sugar ABC transporter substrate-binding protein [Planctomycetota bacterium]